MKVETESPSRIAGAPVAVLLCFALPLPGQTRPPEPKPLALAQAPRNGEAHLVGLADGTGWLRIPSRCKPGVPARLVVWLHGANGSGYEHQIALASRGLGRDEILLCPNGAKRSADWTYNHGGGPGPILAAIEAVTQRHPASAVYLGGHSQGAFLSFRLLGEHAERFAGVVAVSGGLAGGFDAAALVARLGARTPALVIAHGERDPVVGIAQGDQAYERCLAAKWPALRYVHPPRADHSLEHFDLAECFGWIFALTSDRPQELLATARGLAGGDRPGDALFALARAEANKAPAAAVQAVRKLALARGAVLQRQWLDRFAEPKKSGWSEAFYEQSAGLITVPTAAPMFAAFQQLAAAQTPAATQALTEALELARTDPARARSACERILAEHPAALAACRAAALYLRR